MTTIWDLIIWISNYLFLDFIVLQPFQSIKISSSTDYKFSYELSFELPFYLQILLRLKRKWTKNWKEKSVNETPYRIFPLIKCLFILVLQKKLIEFMIILNNSVLCTFKKGSKVWDTRHDTTLQSFSYRVIHFPKRLCAREFWQMHSDRKSINVNRTLTSDAVEINTKR